jgi:hypothetical protein
MPNYPVKPEGDLFEAVKDALMGDNEHGRYSRRVLGEETVALMERGPFAKQFWKEISGESHIANDPMMVTFSKLSRNFKLDEKQEDAEGYAADDEAFKKVVKHLGLTAKKWGISAGVRDTKAQGSPAKGGVIDFKWKGKKAYSLAWDVRKMHGGRKAYEMSLLAW